MNTSCGIEPFSLNGDQTVKVVREIASLVKSFSILRETQQNLITRYSNNLIRRTT